MRTTQTLNGRIRTTSKYKPTCNYWTKKNSKNILRDTIMTRTLMKNRTRKNWKYSSRMSGWRPIRLLVSDKIAVEMKVASILQAIVKQTNRTSTLPIKKDRKCLDSSRVTRISSKKLTRQVPCNHSRKSNPQDQRTTRLRARIILMAWAIQACLESVAVILTICLPWWPVAWVWAALPIRQQ